MFDDVIEAILQTTTTRQGWDLEAKYKKTFDDILKERRYCSPAGTHLLSEPINYDFFKIFGKRLQYNNGYNCRQVLTNTNL